jgi:hypothetical protein
MQYKLRKDENYGDVLQHNGKDTICPHKTHVPVPVQSTMGQMTVQIIQFPCCTLCPLVELIEDWDDQRKMIVDTYVIKCGGNTVEIEISEQDQDSEPIETKLIKI